MSSQTSTPAPLGSAKEAGRLADVRRYDILDTPPDGSFDRITQLAAQLFEVPIAIISIVDHDRIWFKSHHGLEVEQIERAPGLCASAILQDQPWIVADARKDVRTLTNPLVAGEFGLQFYAGVPLHTSDGHNLGTLCVIDREPRPVTETQIQQLRQLSTLVIDQLELRLSARRAISELQQTMNTMRLMSKEIDHRVMNSLQIVASLLSLQSNEAGDTAAAEQLRLSAHRVMTVAQVHRHFYVDPDVITTRLLEFLQRLCADLDQILQFHDIAVTGVEAEVATPHIVPLALIVTELVTNSVKYGATRVRVNFTPMPAGGYSLLVSDNGPGLPADHNLKTDGLGMKVVRALVQQIKAQLVIGEGLEDRGVGFTVLFR